MEVYQNKNFNLYKEIDINVVLKLNEKLKKNINKLQLHAILLPSDQRDKNPSLVDERVVQSSKLTLSKVPEASTFNLMSDEKVEKKDDKKKATKTPHLRSKIFLAAVEDTFIFPLSNVPHEIIRFLKMERIDGKHQYYPIFTIDEMSSRLRDQIEVRLLSIYQSSKILSNTLKLIYFKTFSISIFKDGNVSQIFILEFIPLKEG